MNKKLGYIYKDIRVNKGLSQSYVCDKKISRTTLSRFENGKVAISLTNFHYLLQRIDMSYDEFDFILHNYDYNPSKSIFEDFLSLQSNKNVQSIQTIIAKCEAFLAQDSNWYVHSIYYIMLSLLEDSDFSLVNQEKIYSHSLENLWQQISSQDEWYLIDFRLISAILFIFPWETALEIGGEVLVRIQKYKKFSQVSPVIISIKLNLAVLCLKHGEYQLAANYAAAALPLAKQIKRYDFLIAAKVRYAIALKQTEEINQALEIASLLDDHNLVTALKEEVRLYAK